MLPLANTRELGTRTEASAPLICCMVQARFLQIGWSHDDSELTVRVEIQEPRFGKRWDLGWFVEINDHNTAPRAILFCKIDRFRLGVIHDPFENLAGLALPYGSV